MTVSTGATGHKKFEQVFIGYHCPMCGERVCKAGGGSDVLWQKGMNA